MDAVLAIREEGKPVDLHMVELMEMQHKTATETQLVKGEALDWKLIYRTTVWWNKIDDLFEPLDFRIINSTYYRAYCMLHKVCLMV